MTKKELWKKYRNKETKDEKINYLASLTDEEFYTMLKMPILNIAKIHLNKHRNEKLKEIKKH